MEEGEVEDGDSELLIRRDASNTRYCGFTKTELLFTLAITLMSIGVNFAIDIPASLENAMSQYYHLSQYQFSLFYTLYFFPSLLLNAFGGYLIDKVIGIRYSTIIYCGIATLGIAIFVAGGFVEAVWLMLLGRFLFGLGNEMASNVCMSYCTFTYYSKSSSVNFMFSMSDNMSFIGTVAIFQLGPYLFQLFEKIQTPEDALNNVLLICSTSYILTAITGVWATFIRPFEETNQAACPRTYGTLDPTHSIQRNCDTNHQTDLLRNIHNSNEIPRSSVIENNTNSVIESSRITLFDITKFPAIFWLLCIVYTCFTSAVFTFETFSQGLFTSDIFNLSIKEASDAVTIMNVLKIGLSIPLSLLVDRIGKNILFIVISAILCLISFSLLVFKIYPYFVMVLLGISYSFTGSAIWAMFAYPISKHLRGSCYGVVSAFNGISQTLSPAIVGVLIDQYGFFAAMYFYIANSVVATFTIMITLILDKRSGGILYMNPKERTEMENSIQNSRSGSEDNLLPQDWNPHINEDAPG